jgi:hypothetical protein
MKTNGMKSNRTYSIDMHIVQKFHDLLYYTSANKSEVVEYLIKKFCYDEPLQKQYFGEIERMKQQRNIYR